LTRASVSGETLGGGRSLTARDLVSLTTPSRPTISAATAAIATCIPSMLKWQ
jgi:hypothetical protein